MKKRICLFAHYDRDSIIDDYVLFYLKGLLSVVNKIIFTSDSDLSQKELEKLKGLATIAHVGRHKEYDFGSWKRCFQFVEKELNNYDELILVNDSCFAPFHPFKNVFEKMDKKNLNAWSINWGWGKGNPYMDSCFIVLKKEVFCASFFSKFLNDVKKEKGVKEVVEKYEIGLSREIFDKGFSFDSYIPIQRNKKRTVEAYTSQSFDEIKYRYFPLLKTKILKSNHYDVGHLFQKIQDMARFYPIHLLRKYVKRMCGTQYPQHFFLPYSRFRDQFLHYRFFQIFGKYSKSKKWFYIGFKLFGIPIFRFWIPAFRIQRN